MQILHKVGLMRGCLAFCRNDMPLLFNGETEMLLPPFGGNSMWGTSDEYASALKVASLK